MQLAQAEMNQAIRVSTHRSLKLTKDSHRPTKAGMKMKTT